MLRSMVKGVKRDSTTAPLVVAAAVLIRIVNRMMGATIHFISKSNLSVSKNKIVQNANSALIKIVETYPNYKNNIVKGAGICAAIVGKP